MALWEVDIYPADGQLDLLGLSVQSDARDLGLGSHLKIRAARGFLVEGNATLEEVDRMAKKLLADDIAERAVVGKVGDSSLQQIPQGLNAATAVHVLPKPGVMDPVALSALGAIQDLKVNIDAVRTFRKYWIEGADAHELQRLSQKVLSNDSIEQVVVGPLKLSQLAIGSAYQLQVTTVPIRNLGPEELLKLSKEGQLYLSLAEMQTVQQHFIEKDRDPTDIELETIAQTWSEHCSHKTLAGRIAYRDENGERHFTNMLKETIFASTLKIRDELGHDDWCVSVFKDNAGVVKFDEDYHVVFKVETHNHPSAIEPYGGANTGIGGVIRDPLGTGLGAKPICNTDVFCFAPPDRDPNELPPGVLHPRRVMKGVVAGVRDYGNRMGIPTVNGAVYFDERYLGNPLVYCGNVGLLPVDKATKHPQPGDYIVSLGGRTGRDGIHGATFSSVELTQESESISGGSVQIGNAVMEKMVLDVLLQARDEGLYNAVTDCGAGGFSSAVGEMGEEIGAEVWLDQAPLKYEGLSYTEIWISEAQERMILAVAPDKWERFQALAQSEGVEASILGKFLPTGHLRLMYEGTEVGMISMEFLHGGRPPVVRRASYEPAPEQTVSLGSMDRAQCEELLGKILSSPNVASKHWIIRQYDHEVQAGSVIKPLVGPRCDGPGDAAVVQPRLTSRKGITISCGMNPQYGDLDPYHMACSAIDEAVRNSVAVGADPNRIAILDNFCWGNTDRPETLGTLVRAALACHDVAVAWKTPFISGKDSLNNEFAWMDDNKQKRSIAIPSSLLISALGQVDDVTRCITMDFKTPGNAVYLVGPTRDELGGSHALKLLGRSGGHVPRVDLALAKRIFESMHAAIKKGFVRSCHDLSEGGLAVALAEMAFAGEWGVQVDISDVCANQFIDPEVTLFAESNSRFLVEITPEKEAAFKQEFRDLPCTRLGQVISEDRVAITHGRSVLIDQPWSKLKAVWKAPLDW
ncbi:MAG: phosphoribosylformylglycinamidine synthase subunit PurL [Pirellulales bacterium]